VEPERHIAAFAEAGADRLIVHQEATPHLHRLLQSIGELGVEVGVSINPATPLDVLEEVLHMVDLIQIMTVDPGWGGQAFLHGQLDKIQRLRLRLAERGLEVSIGVDGGVDITTAPLVAEAGATMMVSGSSIYNDEAPVLDNVKALRASVASR
jgi:ribulose-phosphate 3-epimerase